MPQARATWTWRIKRNPLVWLRTTATHPKAEATVTIVMSDSFGLHQMSLKGVYRISFSSHKLAIHGLGVSFCHWLTSIYFDCQLHTMVTDGCSFTTFRTPAVFMPGCRARIIKFVTLLQSDFPKGTTDGYQRECDGALSRNSVLPDQGYPYYGFPCLRLSSQSSQPLYRQ